MLSCTRLLTRLTLRSTVAEDLLQELFIKLHAASGFARATNRKAYVFKTAIHLAFDWRRAQRPTAAIEDEPESTADAPLDRLIGAEEFDHVLQAMQSLPELSRQVLVLRYLQQQDYVDIARQVSKTEHQARGLCSKAIGQLQAMLRPAMEVAEKCELPLIAAEEHFKARNQPAS